MLGRKLWLTFGAVCIALIESQAVQAAPVVQILTPEPKTKIRVNGSVTVKISVLELGGGAWTLSLDGRDGTTVIASGTDAVNQLAVADIAADTLKPGILHELRLQATNSQASVVATSSVMVPDTQFQLIPVHDGSASRRAAPAFYAVDDDGNVVFATGGGDPTPLTIFRRKERRRDFLSIPLASTTGERLSGDGRRLFFKGIFSPVALGYRDLSTGFDVSIDPIGSGYFSVDETGRRIVYQAAVERVDPRKINLQYVLFDEQTREYRRLTSHVGSIDRGADCPSESGGTPLISADGSIIVFLTSSTLGIVSEDPGVGCRVYLYDESTRVLRQIAALPSSWLKANHPSLSGDGRWLSFPVVEVRVTGGSRGVPVLLDTMTGEVQAPIIDTGNFTTFDSTVTRDGNGIVISSQADLDPRVGNADHNLELFHLNRSTGDISQITETVGGVGLTAGGCETYKVSLSGDGSVIAFGLPAFDVLGCRLDGPQRMEENGLWLGYVRAVRKRADNHGVVFDPVGEQRIVVGEEITIHFRASDLDTDLITFYAQVPGTRDILTGSEFVDNLDGTATLKWRPRLEDIGSHVLRVASFDDGGGEDVHDVSIAVLPANDPEECSGACTEPVSVHVSDILLLVNISLGFQGTAQCPAGDFNHDGGVTVDEILRAVENALHGCQ